MLCVRCHLRREFDDALGIIGMFVSYNNMEIRYYCVEGNAGGKRGKGKKGKEKNRKNPSL